MVLPPGDVGEVLLVDEAMEGAVPMEGREAELDADLEVADEEEDEFRPCTCGLGDCCWLLEGEEVPLPTLERELSACGGPTPRARALLLLPLFPPLWFEPLALLAEV